jgi:hypothetical protein
MDIGALFQGIAQCIQSLTSQLTREISVVGSDMRVGEAQNPPLQTHASEHVKVGNMFFPMPNPEREQSVRRVTINELSLGD